MDYMTKPLSRKELRSLASLFRIIFKSELNGSFNVLNALETLPDVFPGSTHLVVEDNDLPANIPARCSPDENGNFIVEIKNSVYQGAYKKENRGL